MVDPSIVSNALPAYAELHCLSNFSFQRGASHPEELVARAHALGYSALAITDECSMAGVVRAHGEAKRLGLHLLIGTELRVEVSDDTAHFTLVLLARSRAGYGQLCELITQARGQTVTLRERERGLRYRLRLDTWRQLAFDGREVLALLAPQRDGLRPEEPGFAAQLDAQLQWLNQHFPQRGWLAVELLHRLDDDLWLRQLRAAGARCGVPLVAAGNVHMHVRSRKPLQDVMTAIQLGQPVAECGYALQPNAEAHLRARLRLAALYPEELLAETVRVAQLCTFSLDELRYEYPQEVVPAGETPSTYLRRATQEGAGRRYPQGVPANVQQQVEHELALIAELGYEKYFLTVYDLVRFARTENILCQGRGSAANSAVCYCLGITEVDPARASVLFERFISRERNEPPDIDVDFEHQRREEVIQYLYAKYGRERAALTAAVHTYHARGAIRDVGRALGMDEAVLDALAKAHQWWDGGAVDLARLQELGLDAESRQIRLLIELTRTLLRFPRHLSQHSGGFVLTGDRLSSTVPVVPAAMAGRTTIEWDKDDIDALGLLKVDVLALGMLSAIRRTLQLVGQWRGKAMRLQDIPPEDPATYEMLCRADTVGVFQVESRAQMSMLPRLQPRCFYDLVVEVAIVRPGPIQGGMVHPYLAQREAQRRGEPFTLPNEALRPALERTLGIPIFQEQVMQIAIIAAGFTPGEADALRRAMAAWRRRGGVDKFQQRLIEGMTARGYAQEFAEAIFRQIEGFGEYGFPESHAASFALLVYASAWLKRHEPACFLAGLLNSLPMGFYGPAQLVQDAQRHGVEVRPPDVQHSDWDCTLEHGESDQPAVRLGLRLVGGLGEASVQRIMAARAAQGFRNTEDLALRAGLDAVELKALASADALLSLSGHRRQQVWDASALHAAPALLREAPVDEEALALPPAPEGEEVVFDYAATGLTLRRHPLALLRERLRAQRLLTSEELQQLPDGRPAYACGLVLTRQQPGTAKGVVFVTLEDETGSVQVIVWKDLRDRQRATLLRARLLAVYGTWQRQGEVCHLIAGYLEDLTPLLGGLMTESRDFR
ncbi:MAG: error-prone DNA polymerase [Hylemonella sp.]|uniref:error-prone DNA polymerase n=1 Tax=Hylemonella sp. TaxID=2066020 RepID=UPI0022CAFF49|nr:error-prone DNA polymerase [Hylemonella sp.]MCZ8252433.1 error-prone DNA polymerase [Hylemonella sp.]